MTLRTAFAPTAAQSSPPAPRQRPPPRRLRSDRRRPRPSPRSIRRWSRSRDHTSRQVAETRAGGCQVWGRRRRRSDGCGSGFCWGCSGCVWCSASGWRSSRAPEPARNGSKIWRRKRRSGRPRPPSDMGDLEISQEDDVVGDDRVSSLQAASVHRRCTLVPHNAHQRPGATAPDAETSRWKNLRAPSALRQKRCPCRPQAGTRIDDPGMAQWSRRRFWPAPTRASLR